VGLLHQVLLRRLLVRWRGAGVVRDAPDSGVHVCPLVGERLDHLRPDRARREARGQTRWVGWQLGGWLLLPCLLQCSSLELLGCLGGLRGWGLDLLDLLVCCHLRQGERGRLGCGCLSRPGLLGLHLDYLLSHALHLLPQTSNCLQELGHLWLSRL
jgi:hypothetical protein